MSYAVTVYSNLEGLQKHARSTGGFATFEDAAAFATGAAKAADYSHHAIIDTASGMEVTEPPKVVEPEEQPGAEHADDPPAA